MRFSAERVALAATILGIAGVIVAPFYLEHRRQRARGEAGVRVITLTGLAESGVWTEAEVTGGNYFAGEFPPARPVLEVGEPVLFRFKSADVIHDFYSPGLGIGPVEVYPGQVAEWRITPESPGVFDYYCTTVCGPAHFRMRGQILVGVEAASTEDPGRFWLEEEPPPEDGLAARGEWLFRRHGCFTCHGPSGHGGVSNLNYVKGTVPALDTLAEDAYLYEPEDVGVIVDALERRVPLEDLWDDPPLPLFNVVLAKYQAVRELIRTGVKAGKLDPAGPEPPLQMPAWGQILDDEEIDALIAYLLTLKPLDYAADVG